MTKREKVIRGAEVHSSEESCSMCPYKGEELCTTELFKDVIALLKEQEPKMVVQTTSTIRCPGCGKQITSKGALHKDINYCWKCGQAVKWDG